MKAKCLNLFPLRYCSIDIIDDYYLRDDVFTDDVTEPPQISPPAPSIVTPPDIDSPVWSYSEDEYSPAWSYSEDEHSPMTQPAGLPSSKPDMAQCAVSVMIDRCPSLLQSIGPKEECDCYNFCGGLYLGCCAIDEPCPLTCDVAGEVCFSQTLKSPRMQPASWN